jgi:hypothetical protein
VVVKRAWLVLLAIAGCDLNPYEIGGRTSGDGGSVGDGGSGDAGDAGSGSDGATCVPIGVDDQCNEIDDDCDGVIDQAFNKQSDPSHCGTCNHRCVGAGALQTCQSGQCVFVACQPGFADLDNDPLTCEYQCPLFPTIAEDCNGVDDDCDGRIDETLPAPPTGQCRVTPNTPCEGTTMVCETRGSVTRWWCNYGAGVEFDPSIPNGIVLEEQLCDGADGDCDGVADDSFSDLDQECDDGGIGVCRDVGKRVCNPADRTQTMCDLSVLPDAQAPGLEQCDGLDNNCDGIVDNSSGPDRVIDAMTAVTVGPSTFWIDTYEASHPDASASSTGVGTARACSKTGVLPWRGATFAAAQSACAAAGKTLCTGTQWQTACKSAANTTWPYGNVFEPQYCNTETFDGIPGGADDDVLIATGQRPQCVASWASGGQIFDMSGNLKEWTNDITGQSNGIDLAVQRGGSYATPSAGSTCEFRLTRAAVNVVEQETGFRCCKLTAP